MPGKEQRERNTPHYSLEHWKPADVPAISRLEQACWAPWLRKPEPRIATIATIFPQGQLLLRDKHKNIIAIMTANRIDWDGRPASLTTWDAVVGGSEEESDYRKTYRPDGNTLCITSSSIVETQRGAGLSPRLMTGMQQVATELGATYLIGPFRPYGYGEYKLQHEPIDFAEYCALTQENGEPLDPWLRSVFRLGMKPLRVEERSMVITVDMNTFETYRQTYNPQKWKEVVPGRWECGETGSWFVTGNTAVYIEPNVWGELG
jgi:hypothetical protein